MNVRQRLLKSIGVGLLMAVVFPGLALAGWALLYVEFCREVGLFSRYCLPAAILIAAFLLLSWAAYAAYLYRHPIDEPIVASLGELSLRDRILFSSNLVGWTSVGWSPWILYRLGISTGWLYFAVPMACLLGGMAGGLLLADWAEQRLQPSVKLRPSPKPSTRLEVEELRLAATWAGITSGACVLVMWGIVWPRLTHFWLLRDLLWISFLTPLPYLLALVTGVLARFIILRLLVSRTISRRGAIIGSIGGTILVCLAVIVTIELS